MERPPAVRGRLEAFFLPKFRSAEEARRAATWMYKTEAERLREILSDVDFGGTRVP